jgi:hypothetical protein
MPTDGTDFARRKACYGRFYTASKDGVPVAVLGSIALEGLARDIRRDGGLPAFRPLVEHLVGIMIPGLLGNDDMRKQLMDGVDHIDQELADFSLTRDACGVARKVGLEALSGGIDPSEESIKSHLVAGLVKSRCLDRASPYITRHRTRSIHGTEQLTKTVAQATLPNALILAEAIYKSPKGVPPRGWDGTSSTAIEHTATALNNEVIAEICN